MTYIIEDSSHTLVKTINNLSAVQRPDGGITTNAKVDEQLHDESGDEYFIRRIETVVVGEGPRNLGKSTPSFKDGRWIVEHKRGAALPPPPDPQPGDDNYDYAELRRQEFNKNLPMGDQADALLKWATSIRMKQSAVADAVDGLTIEQLPNIVTSAAVEGDPDDVVTPGTIQLTADSLNDLKSALAPIFDLPADLDGIVGQWTAVKAKFPKE